MAPPIRSDRDGNRRGWRVYPEPLYPSDAAGFAALFAAAGSGNTTPSAIVVAPIVQAPGNSPSAVMSQEASTAALVPKLDIVPATSLSLIQTGYAAGSRVTSTRGGSLCQTFRSTVRAADIGYGVTTQVLGIAFKSGQYGMLYSAESNHASVVFYGYILGVVGRP